MLRPYRELDGAILQDVMAALQACSELFAGTNVPRDLVSAVWSISRLGRLWGIAPGGMLQRNGLISDEESERLGRFLEEFDLKVLTLLEAGDSSKDAEGSAEGCVEIGALGAEQDFVGSILALIERKGDLNAVAALLRAYRDAGHTADEAYVALSALRGHLEEEVEDALLEVLDLVVGWCQPRYRVWPEDQA